MTDTLIGATIGGYQILEEVGEGGMATVYRAHQLSMDRDVAFKVLSPQLLHESASLDRFKQEASIVARLEHRAIVPVHDYGEYEGMPYIVMRYMDGGSVDEMLVDGPLPPEQTLTILQQIAPALDYANREGVLHRDLKPSNILLDANGDAYLTDFGIARILGVNPKPLTTSGVVGTPSYMSPEQAQGHDLDGRSDVYALGVVLFEMLTGVRPFEGETPYSVAVKHVTEPVPSACAINPALTPAVELVLIKALAKNRDLRYRSATELAAALLEALEQPEQDLSETEPSLNEALRSEMSQAASSPPLVPPPPESQTLPPLQRTSPDIQVMPAYVPPVSRPYTPAPLSQPRRRPKKRGLAAWPTWAAMVLVIGGLLLAAGLVGGYYLLNSGRSSDNTITYEDYNATAIFKLTATRQAIESGTARSTATIPPTNTPRFSGDDTSVGSTAVP
jgi:serine/threonine protein kinase